MYDIIEWNVAFHDFSQSWFEKDLFIKLAITIK